MYFLECCPDMHATHTRTHSTPQVQTDETYLLSELSSKGKDAKKADFENLGVSAPLCPLSLVSCDG